jgi:flavorubredoxin
MATATEIAPNVYRISIFAPWGDLQFNHFLIRDQEPLLFHTGLRGMFAEISEAVSKIIALPDLRHISFSHFESDECGSLNDWLAVAPQAEVSPRLGRRRLFEETHGTLLCPDLFHQTGDVEPLTESDVVGRS